MISTPRPRPQKLGNPRQFQALRKLWWEDQITPQFTSQPKPLYGDFGRSWEKEDKWKIYEKVEDS